MKRVLFFLYGLGCYATFQAAFLYLLGFMTNLFVPRSIDSATTTSTATAVGINLLLIAVFGLQHTVMARPTFKKWFTKLVPTPIERSTYVLLSNVALALLFWFWQPINAVVWDVQSTWGRTMLFGGFSMGVSLVFVCTVLLNHFELFGLRQVWLYLRGQEHSELTFKTPIFYKFVRHPLYLGWTMAFWITPTMTVGHLLFAGSMSLYMFIAIYFEERNLIELHGRNYVEYRKQVPMMIPIPGKNFEPSPQPVAITVS